MKIWEFKKTQITYSSFLTKFANKYSIVMFNKKKIAWVSLYCDRNMNDVISTGEMPSENTRRSRVFSGIYWNGRPLHIAVIIFVKALHIPVQASGITLAAKLASDG